MSDQFQVGEIAIYIGADINCGKEVTIVGPLSFVFDSVDSETRQRRSVIGYPVDISKEFIIDPDLISETSRFLIEPRLLRKKPYPKEDLQVDQRELEALES